MGEPHRYQKGHPKMGGRQKGTPNKPKPYAIFMKEFLEQDQEQFMEDYFKLDEKDRMQVRQAMYKFVVPALASVDVQGNMDVNSSGLERIKQMSQE